MSGHFGGDKPLGKLQEVIYTDIKLYIVLDLSGLCQAEDAYIYMYSTYTQYVSGKADACGFNQHPWPKFSKSNQYILVSGDYSHT